MKKTITVRVCVIDAVMGLMLSDYSVAQIQTPTIQTAIHPKGVMR